MTRTIRASGFPTQRADLVVNSTQTPGSMNFMPGGGPVLCKKISRSAAPGMSGVSEHDAV